MDATDQNELPATSHLFDCRPWKPWDAVSRICSCQSRRRKDGSTIKVNDFLTGESTTFQTEKPDSFELGPFASGDNGLMQSFFAAVASGDRQLLLSGPAETIESHRMVFAAEQARRERSVINLQGI